MEKERKYYKYIRSHLNAKTGAVIGGLSSLVLSTIIVATNPEFRELPIESKIQAAGFATGILTLGFTTAFHIMGWGSNKIDNYFESEKVKNYFDRLARR